MVMAIRAKRAIRAWLKRRKERENIWPMYFMSQHVNKGSWPCGGIRCIVGSDSGLPWFHWILLSGTLFLRRCKPTMDIWWCSDGQFLFPFFFSFFALISTHVFLFFPALTFFLLSLLYLEPIFGLVKFSRFNHKVMIRKFRSCHLILWLLGNLMVYKSPGKGTTFAKKRRITS